MKIRDAAIISFATVSLLFGGAANALSVSVDNSDFGCTYIGVQRAGDYCAVPEKWIMGDDEIWRKATYMQPNGFMTSINTNYNYPDGTVPANGPPGDSIGFMAVGYNSDYEGVGASWANPYVHFDMMDIPHPEDHYLYWLRSSGNSTLVDPDRSLGLWLGSYLDVENSWIDYGSGPVSLSTYDLFTWADSAYPAGTSSYETDVFWTANAMMQSAYFVYTATPTAAPPGSPGSPAAVPEPESLTLLLGGLALVGLTARHRRRMRSS